MSKLVNFVGSGIGLAYEISASRQSTSKTTTSRSVTRDASHGSGTRGNFSTRHQDGQEYGSQTDYQDDLSVSWSSHPGEREYHNSQEKKGIRTCEEEWNPQDPGNNSMQLPPPYTAEEYGESANRVLPLTLQRPSSPSTTVRGRLPCPVIIPQRRPENQERGFIRAYAPALLECGIDEATFINFIDSLNQAVKASPVFDAVNVGAFAAGFAPSVAAQVTSVVTSITVRAAKSKQITRQSNAFLDKYNEQLFEPHGLLCAIMTYKPDQKSSTVGVDMLNSGFQRKGISSGATHGELDMPEAAALVFSDDDAATAGNKSLGSVTAEYFDKRSQAKYSKANPDSPLCKGPEPQFYSRFGDPNHAANNGGLISIATGGPVNLREGRRSERSANRREQKDDRHADRRRGRQWERPSLIGGLRESLMGRGQDRKPQTLVGGARGKLKDGMKQDVLYLMIVNKPTE